MRTISNIWHRLRDKAGVIVTILLLVVGLASLSYLAQATGQNNAGNKVEPASATDSAADNGQTTVSLKRMRRIVQNSSAVIVDARSPERFSNGHIPGAVNLPARQQGAPIPREVTRRSQYQPVVVYCSSPSCSDSERVARRLRAAGLDPVKLFEGGWQAWLRR